MFIIIMNCSKEFLPVLLLIDLPGDYRWVVFEFCYYGVENMEMEKLEFLVMEFNRALDDGVQQGFQIYLIFK